MTLVHFVLKGKRYLKVQQALVKFGLKLLVCCWRFSKENKNIYIHILSLAGSAEVTLWLKAGKVVHEADNFLFSALGVSLLFVPSWHLSSSILQSLRQ